MQDTKKLTVAYGSFACVVEGFDDPFPVMQETVAYFESLSRLNPEFAHQSDIGDFETLRERFSAEGAQIDLVSIPGGVAIRNVAQEVDASATVHTDAAAVAGLSDAGEDAQQFDRPDPAFQGYDDPEAPDESVGEVVDQPEPASDLDQDDLESEEALAALRLAMSQMPKDDGTASDVADAHYPDMAETEEAPGPDTNRSAEEAFDQEFGTLDASLSLLEDPQSTEPEDQDFVEDEVGIETGSNAPAEQYAHAVEDDEDRSESASEAAPETSAEAEQGVAEGSQEDSIEETSFEQTPLPDEPLSDAPVADDMLAEADSGDASNDEPEGVLSASDKETDSERAQNGEHASSEDASDAPEEPLATDIPADDDDAIAQEVDTAPPDAHDAAEAEDDSPTEDPETEPSVAEADEPRDAKPAPPLVLGDMGETTDTIPEIEDDPDTLVFAKTAEPKTEPAPLALTKEQAVKPANADVGDDNEANAESAVLRLGTPSDDSTAKFEDRRPPFIDSRVEDEQTGRDKPYGSGHTPLVLGKKADEQEEDGSSSKGGFLKILKGGSQSEAPAEPDPAEKPETLEFSDGEEAEREDTGKSGFGLGRMLGWGKKSSDEDKDEAPSDPFDRLTGEQDTAAQEEPRRAPLRVVTDNTDPEDAPEPAAPAPDRAVSARDADPEPAPESAEPQDMSERLHASFAAATPRPTDSSFSIEEADLDDEGEKSAKRFAFQVGADSLPELMKACAAFLIYAEGKDAFTRGELLSTVQEAAGANAFSAEARIRAFAKLVRGGEFTKVEGGGFVLSARVVEGYRDHLRSIAV